MSNPISDPFSVDEREESGVKVIRVDVARLLEVVGAGEWMAIHADPESGLAALRLNPRMTSAAGIGGSSLRLS